MNKTNTMIVGQGIAGSIIAFMLYQKKIPFVVVDPAQENTASLVAAGMFTPISGKRKTIHPLTLEQIPFAIDVYRSIELLLGLDLIHVNPIYYVFGSAVERDEVFNKAAREDFANYVSRDVKAMQGIKEPNGAVEISHSGWVNCAVFIRGFREWLQQQQVFVQQQFDYQALTHSEGYMQYNNWQFENIIFCEGYKGINNPFFAEEKIIPCKGDVLSVYYEHLAATCIIKKNKCYLVPVGEHLYKVGSTYSWRDASTLPTAAAQLEIETALQELLEKPYKVIDHKTAIRPTTGNREVIMSRHPQYKKMFMFNGLGTKGVIQGPWWADYLVEKYFTNLNK